MMHVCVTSYCTRGCRDMTPSQSDAPSRVTVFQALAVLGKRDKEKYILLTLLQIIFNFLDLFGVLIVGALAGLVVTSTDQSIDSSKFYTLLELIGIQNFAYEELLFILSISAIVVLSVRTVLSMYFTKKVTFFLSHKGAEISAKLINFFLNKPMLDLQKKTNQEIVYAVTIGVESITLKILAAYSTIYADLALLIIITVSLFVIDPFSAALIVALFSIISGSLYFYMHVKALKVGRETSRLAIKTNSRILEILNSYRESFVRNRSGYYAEEIGRLRREIADLHAQASFFPYVSKYVIESSVVIGGILLAGVQLLLQDTAAAITVLAMFLASGSRIAPAVLRLQQGAITVKSSRGFAELALNAIHEMKMQNVKVVAEVPTSSSIERFKPEVTASFVSYTYPNRATTAVKNITLEVFAGETIAIVGGSGSGKTTLLDLILGILTADEGEIQVSGMPAVDAIKTWPGKIAYVPQDIEIIDGTISENVSMGYSCDVTSVDAVRYAIEMASLTDFVATLENGVDTYIGEKGVQISGGQRQRLGIARALYTKPELIVLDEATSALDGETESDITNAISNLRNKVTVISVAHRLSSVRLFDRIYYLEGGELMAEGTFDEVRKKSKSFDLQARSMGL